MLKNVRQRGLWGCGLACAASVLGVSYSQAKALAKALPGNDQTVGYKRWEIRELLRLGGRRYRRPRSLNGARAGREARLVVAPGTIVYVWNENEYGTAGHYLVRTRRGWMDPQHGHVARLPGVPLCVIEPA